MKFLDECVHEREKSLSSQDEQQADVALYKLSSCHESWACCGRFDISAGEPEWTRSVIGCRNRGHDVRSGRTWGGGNGSVAYDIIVIESHISQQIASPSKRSRAHTYCGLPRFLGIRNSTRLPPLHRVESVGNIRGRPSLSDSTAAEERWRWKRSHFPRGTFRRRTTGAQRRGGTNSGKGSLRRTTLTA